MINATLIIYAFRPTPTEVQFEAALDLELSKSSSRSSAVPSDSQKLPTDVDPATMHNVTVSMELSAPSGSLLAAIKKPYMWAFSLFAWLYTGSESSTQGFIVLYLLGTRSANPNTVGYVTSGFWGGMAVSRMIWGYMGPL
ncbi:hypothetical protein A0H81_00540 [Grifola frondosa]|uniref:Uncharacterized protein n=1 Tax=Grifola frondosa TaxID=5627 RepID=A0A1C7MRV6_GRIFR|nr:hypothetical protein A0H81_00540 [Grifola frondosa]